MTTDRSGSKDSGLAPETEALIAHERELPQTPDDVRARLLSRANAAVLEGPPAHQPPPARALFGKPLVAGAAAVVVAAVIAAVIALRSGSANAPSLPTASVSSPTPSVAPAPPLPPSALLAPPPPAPSAKSAPEEPLPPKARATASGREASGLEEVQLLSRARRAGARGDYAEVLSVVSEHERSFPAGRLSEEREVLRVKALVGLGRTEEARRAAAKFRRRFPRSVLLDTVDQMLP